VSDSENENTSNNSGNNSASQNNSGKWIVAVIIGGAIWVGVSPIVGAMLVKDKHLELSGKPPEPLNISKSAGFGYLNKAREGQPYTLPADLQASAAPSPPSSSLSGLGLSGSGMANSGIAGSSATAKVLSQADTNAIRERFARSIIAMKPTASHPAASSTATATTTSSSTSSSTSSLGLDERMNAVTKLCLSGKNAEGLAEADKFLAYIDKTPGIDSQYKVATAALAMQMADALHQIDRAKGYSQTALTASRASEDYLIEKIEPVYYGLRGSKVNFSTLQQLIKQYESDVANARSANALAQAKQIVAATDSLPPQSFFRIKARIFLAHSQFVNDLNESAARRELIDIKQTAESAGDKEMAKVCQNIINGLGGPI
jgi:hypothetical protein